MLVSGSSAAAVERIVKLGAAAEDERWLALTRPFDVARAALDAAEDEELESRWAAEEAESRPGAASSPAAAAAAASSKGGTGSG